MNFNAGRILLFFVNFVFGLIEIIIGFRILLLMLGANPNTPVVSWIYSVSANLLYPFQNIFPSPVLGKGFVLDMSALVGLLIYAVISYLITELIKFISYTSNNYYVSDKRKHE